ncbi:MAG: peptidoglycan-binding protein [Myxococcales bacterium]|nr:peptidoglycan-binding protein [Myxococcales bacterium]
MSALASALAALVVGHALSAGCPSPVAVYTAGTRREPLCPAAAEAAGMTVLELGDAWAPYPLDGAARSQGAEPPAYRAAYLALADGRFDEAPEGELAADDRFLELFGIPPNGTRVLAMMDDDARHRCHDQISDAALEAAPLPLRYERADRAKARRAALARDRKQVAAYLRRFGLDDPAALATRAPSYAHLVARLERAEAIDAAIRGLQEHLRCDGLLGDRAREGTYDWPTREAVDLFQRRHVIVASGELEADTREALITPSRELDFRLALRFLRQRVADAAGLIADGSARGESEPVLGRVLDEPALRYQGAYPPLADGAHDSLATATEAAALGLGWTSFDSARAGLRRALADEHGRVAVYLPPPPPYQRPGTRVRAVIDPGDVDYDYPFTKSGMRLTKPVERRPVLILYAEVEGREIPLVRWPTTIGGWQEEKLGSGAVVHRYKGSDVGTRLWRDLVVAPAWYPPDSTPDDDLVRATGKGWRLKEDLIGPSYRSAYGMVMLIHHRPIPQGDRTVWYDHGIRTHGSVNYRSILQGSSHGCHRLYNQHAIRLTTFLLRTQPYRVRGRIDEAYRHVVRYKGRRWVISRDERGYAYELTPPVPIEVLAGTPVGARKTPPTETRWR